MVGLGRYEIVKHLAQGGMADVLLARTTGIEGFARHVVIKRIRADQARDRRYVEMFLDEARLAAALHHHHIVQVFDIGRDHGAYFFAMEYVHGEDARSLLSRACERRQHVPLDQICAIICAAAAGLHHAHEQRAPDRTPLGIVHRDVSPANIMIGYDGGVKVADFGIAKAVHRRAETESGTLKGKVAYMSPEQCVGEPVDRRSDVFALGIVLYELVTVRRLFKAENDFLTMAAIVLGHVPPPSRYRPDLPPALEQIMLKALANKPADRYQTAEELRRALERFAEAHALRMSSTALADYMREVFGARPEPWLDAGDDLDFDIDLDFDGSASGVVMPPLDALGALAVPAPTPEHTEPPIARARRRVRATTLPADPRAVRARARSPRGSTAATATARPIRAPEPIPPEDAPRGNADALEPIAPRPRTRRVLVGFACAVAIGVAVGVVGAGAVPGGEAASSSRRPAAVAPEPAPVVREPVLTEPVLTSPAPPPAVVPVDAAAPAPSPVAGSPRPPVVAPKPRPRKRWDPDALFPE